MNKKLIDFYSSLIRASRKRIMRQIHPYSGGRE
jgi:hypothetical protein